MSHKVSYEQPTTLDTVQFTLERVAAGLAAGHLQLFHEDHSVMLEPRPVVHLTLEAKSSGREQHLTVKMRWLRNSLDVGPTARGSENGSGDHGETYDQLYARARRLGVEGRSRMTKSELVRALLHRRD